MNQFKTVALLGLLSALLITIGYWLIGGWTGAFIGMALAAVTNLGSWYFSDRIALAAYGAQPISYEQAPNLYQMVQKLCDRAGLPMPGVYIVSSPAANAFATGRDPEHAAVAVTEGILNILPDDELEAVIAHELSHIYNRDTLTQAVSATIAGAISFIAQMVSYSMWFSGGRDDRDGPNPLGMLLTVILAPIAATVIQLGISRTREFSADAGAAKLTGNPRALARALQRLEAGARQMPIEGNPAFEPLLIINSFSGEFLGNLFSTHPSTEARIQALLKLEQQLPSRY
ncbi:zinc metalloprotease HtpX [Planktothrix sp. FACHB-1355]|uniref:Protease HtpX homolog n=1 Tax=Aerosakkonema funiforme FACHB-1375 TaxID=2949571 RepID=A0A926VNM0_9CYAN|nr:MULTISPECIES: zinc metalloprotease HtpX [Oscillatoriales]MBD2186162.1 zinc metalloprotease HtpX [Aerosakkonema funiforme FACHB-1375]MBD3562447.1 zinc metalloprotease HtpX [Planktothrix sp. FACHB-1355]